MERVRQPSPAVQMWGRDGECENAATEDRREQEVVSRILPNKYKANKNCGCQAVKVDIGTDDLLACYYHKY